MRRFVALLFLLSSISFSETQARTDPLIQFLQNYVGTVEANKDTKYTTAFADLKDDGTKEAIVYLSSEAWCGTGGCTMLIMAPDADSYKLVTKIPAVRLPIRVLTTITNGWHDISVVVGGGGMQSSYEAKLSFDGSSYSDNPPLPPVHRMRGKATEKILMSVTATGKPLFQQC